jgi:hypothetical protein
LKSSVSGTLKQGGGGNDVFRLFATIVAGSAKI